MLYKYVIAILLSHLISQSKESQSMFEKSKVAKFKFYASFSTSYSAVKILKLREIKWFMIEAFSGLVQYDMLL